MPQGKTFVNCRKAAESLADSWMWCETLKYGLTPGKDEKTVEYLVGNLAEELHSFFDALKRRPFEGFDHDIANLEHEADIAKKTGIRQDMITRYAEDLQKQIIGQGLLDVIDCQCKLK